MTITILIISCAKIIKYFNTKLVIDIHMFYKRNCFFIVCKWFIKHFCNISKSDIKIPIMQAYKFVIMIRTINNKMYS